MTKDKMVKLVKYQVELKEKISGVVPPKHTGHPETYKKFLQHELKMVTNALDAAKLVEVK